MMVNNTKGPSIAHKTSVFKGSDEEESKAAHILEVQPRR